MTEPKRISKRKFLKELNDFKNLTQKEKSEIFQLAWDSRKFEIELYWKRAGYFWAFQALAIAGYFTISSSNDYQEKVYHEFYSICLGLITALGWYLINKGSKSWQRHWEKIIDILEDYTIGKLYKTGTTPTTFSVSKINELISLFFTLSWSFLFLNQLIENHLASCWSSDMDLKIIVPLTMVLLFVYSAFWGKGRGRFGKRTIKFYRRKIKLN
ncbi:MULTISPECIES: RipA family octameric membrane protein [Arenibacter]|uniref:RipA family octameric membrane protein n=1 Tax=Arenibacter TaxID=178469 RepID=UPI00054F967B|nr:MULTISPECIES: hypothetical protein [Arenibacter]GBF20352.1 hypothetical protein C21_02523 [Arenibacter sp. NBRC 103722]